MSYTIEDQLALEEEMLQRGVEAFHIRENRAAERGRESRTSYGQYLLQRAMEPLMGAIQAYIDAHLTSRGRTPTSVIYLQQVSLDVVAMITSRTILDTLTRGVSLQRVATSIASQIEDHVKWEALEAKTPKIYKLIVEDLKKNTRHVRHRHNVLNHSLTKHEVEWESWPEHQKVLLGTRLIDIFKNVTGLIDLELVGKSRNKGHYQLKPTEKCLELVRKRQGWVEMLYPQYVPTIIPPRPWVGPREGGYYHPRVSMRTGLIKGRSNLSDLTARVPQMPTIYAALNAVQSTPWAVNKAVLAVALHLWDIGVEVVGLPSQAEITIPERPDDIDTNDEVRKAWRSQAHDAHRKRREMQSKIIQASKILGVARRFQHYPEFYYPHQYDFRGRMYPIPTFLNPQGSKLAKGLLQFAVGKPLRDERGAGWLMIHGANCWGYDKVSLEDRIAWVEENEEWILKVGNDPLENMQWTQADSPWQFLAFALEYAGYKVDGYEFVSHLPISQDGSCNGLQHFSAIIRDPVGGAAVNLLPSTQPSDIYQQVADRVVEKLKAIYYGDTDGGDEELLASEWLALGIDRSTVKRAVMVLPYGGTRFSCRQYLEESLVGKPVPWADPFKACTFLSQVVIDSIHEIVVAAPRVMGVLQQWAKLVSKTGEPVSWTTPDGFPVVQPYRDTKMRRVRTALGDGVIWLSTQVEGDKVDVRRQINGVSPNFVHSLDGEALRRYVLLAQDNGVDALMVVHDAFGTHACDTDVSRACIVHAFVDLYQSADPLVDLYEQLVTTLPEEEARKLAVPPPWLGLDINEVRESTYFFA